MKIGGATRFKAGVYHPAMLAVVRDLDGNPVTFHRTFIHDDGKPPFGTSRRFMPDPLPVGAHVRLGAVQAELGIAEGVETAMACMQRFGLPVWSALDKGHLGNWQPPPELKLLHIFGDNDQNGGGQSAAEKLAKRMQAYGIETNIRIIEHIAGMPSSYKDDDLAAKQFDYLILQSQLAVLHSDPSLSKWQKKIMGIASNLEELGNVPMVKAEMALIIAVQTDEFWEGMTLPILESLRRKIRMLVKLIEPKERKNLYTGFVDEIGGQNLYKLARSGYWD